MPGKNGLCIATSLNCCGASPPTPTEIQVLLRGTCFSEPRSTAGAAALAATRTLSAADRQRLVGALAAARDRGPTRRVNDSRLHLAVAAASGSPSLAASVADVQLTLDRLLAAIPVIRRNLDHSDAQHDRIVDAILHGDAVAARAAMEEHCDGTAELLRGLLG